jgi:hypothetical protein
MTDLAFIRFFDHVGIEDVTPVGGKNASLGELYGQMSNPDLAFKRSLLPDDGVGLACMEFIMSTSLNADTVLKTTRHVLDVARRLGRASRGATQAASGGSTGSQQSAERV